MALIENLDRGDWREFLGSMFGYTLDVLQNDRYRSAGSAVDDLRAWLARGGVSRVKATLADQTRQRGYTAEKQADILAFVDQLAERHRPQLLELAAQRIIGGHLDAWLAGNGLPPDLLRDIPQRIIAGEQPSPAWADLCGCSDEEISETYRLIDEWLGTHGLKFVPVTLPLARSGAAPPKLWTGRSNAKRVD